MGTLSGLEEGDDCWALTRAGEPHAMARDRTGRRVERDSMSERKHQNFGSSTSLSLASRMWGILNRASISVLHARASSLKAGIKGVSIAR